MATKTNKGSIQGGKVKFRVIEFELEGSDESLHDGLKNLAAALLRSGNASGTRQINHSPRIPAGADGSATEQGDNEVEEEVVEVDDVEPLVVKRPAASRRPVAVKVLDGIAFDDVSPSLPEFFSSKKPANVLDKYLVIAYWYKNYRKITDLTVDHFHTALRYLNQATPKDAMQPIRDLRHRKRGKFSGGKMAGTCTINHVGENAVRDLG